MPDTKENKKRKVTAEINRANLLDRAASKLLQQADPNYEDRRALNAQDTKIQTIIDRQLDIAHGVAGGQIVDFMASLKDDSKKRNSAMPRQSQNVDTADLFTENIGDIFGYFQDIYKNRYLEVSDLKFISRFIPIVGKAIQLYISSIISSDDVSQTITRNIILPSSTDPSETAEIMAEVERLEDDLKILKKLKIAYTKTLVSGTFYVYHISYKELFETYSRGLANGKIRSSADGGQMFHNSNSGNVSNGGRGGMVFNQPKHSGKKNKDNVLNVATEAVGGDQPIQRNGSTYIYDATIEPALESFGDETTFLASQGMIRKCAIETACESFFTDIHTMATEAKNVDSASKIADTLIDSIRSDIPNVYFMDTAIPFDIINDVSGIAQEGYSEFFNESKGVSLVSKMLEKNNVIEVPDGTYDSEKSGESFTGVSGTYLKWIDFKYVIPVEILGRKIGYYHVLTTPKTRKKGNRGGNGSGEIGSILSGGSMSLFNQLDVSERRKEAAIQGIVDTISNAIMDQFDAKFVKKNSSFKQTIADCIIANGIVDNDYMIQFIPADHMIEFNCEEDENGKGTSIIADTTFPAHMLLSIVACKMLNYINKGGNKTIAHISSGRVNRNLTGQVNRVIRDIQMSNVTMTDMLSSSQVFSKVTRDSNIAMPKDAQGNKLVEFETQEGQQIELNTEYEQMLERWCAISCRVPPTIVDYEGDVAVAKKVVSDNIQVAGTVASLQSDLEGPTTELYRVLLKNSDMNEENKIKAAQLKFKLPRPRILVNQNNSEALGTAYANAQVLSNVLVGEDANEPDDMLLKRILVEESVKKETPFIDWKDMDELLLVAKARVEKIKLMKQVEAAKNATIPPQGDGSDITGSSDYATNQENGMTDENPDNGEPQTNTQPQGNDEGAAGVNLKGLEF